MFGLGWDTGRGTRTLHIDDNDRCFHHCRHAETLGHQGESTPRSRAHGADARVSGANGHIDHSDLVLNLPDHDSGSACMSRHPVQYAGRRTHRISTVEFHSGRHASHSERDVARKYSVLPIAHCKRMRKRLKVCGRIIVTGTRNIEVFSYDIAPLSHELFPEDLCKRLKTYAHKFQ